MFVGRSLSIRLVLGLGLYLCLQAGFLATFASSIAVAAPSDEEVNRDEDIFGSPTEAPDPAAAPESTTTLRTSTVSKETETITATSATANAVEEEPSGPPPVSNERDAIFESDENPATTPPGGAIGEIADQLKEAADFLDLGGELWLWLEYNALYDGDFQDFSLRSPSFVDLYADARPTDRVRGFVQGRIRHDMTVIEGEADTFGFGQARPQTEALLDQLWIKTDVLQTVFITAGRQRVRWGAGRFWNPTDFLNAQRRDPLAVFDQRIGVGLIRLHLPIEAYGWNFYAIANIDRASTLERVGGAFRAEIVFGQTEVTTSIALRKDEPVRLGADFNTGIGWFDVKGELALLKGVKTPFFRGTLAPERLIVPEAYLREDDWIPQAVASLELSVPVGDEDSVTFGAEYFYNNAGYSDRALYPWLIVQGAFTPLYLGRHYAAAYAVMMGPGRWDDTTLLLSGLGNLSDRSFIVRFDYSVRLLSYLDLRVFVSGHVGREGEFKFRVSQPPIAGISAIDPRLAPLEDGIFISPPLADVGVTLTVAL